mgnify:CR=1 FL=1
MAKYLFIGAHCDEEICFAGTMAKLSEQGNHVQFCAMSWCGREDLKDECLASSKILGVHLWINNFSVRGFKDEAKNIANYFYSLQDYDYIFTHSPYDKHPDHRTIGEESRRVFKGNLVTYLAPWNGNDDPNYFVEISPSQMQKKIDSVRCYKSQAYRKYMDPEFIRAQAIFNGIKAGVRYAEGFTLVKGIDFVQICTEFSNHTLRNVAQPLQGGIRY